MLNFRSNQGNQIKTLRFCTNHTQVAKMSELEYQYCGECLQASSVAKPFICCCLNCKLA